MAERRVAVTGLGAVTALGPDLESFASGLRDGRSGLRELTLFDPAGYRSRLAGQAPDPTASVAESNVSRPDLFGVQAAREAVAASGLPRSAFARAAVAFGTGTGGAALTEKYLSGILRDENPPPSLLVAHQPASVTDLVARTFDIRGPRTTIMTACSSSATAIGWAADQIRLGRCEVALGGGAEGLCRLIFAGFSSLRALSAEPCRPFDAERKGLNLGEGAAVLVLEEYEHARARGAEIFALVAGWGLSADAHHMTAPHPQGDGAARAMQAALADARLDAAAVDYVNAHGTATPYNDSAETAALKTVFGERAAKIPVSSIKSMVGHTLGAAGAIEAVASVLAIARKFLPPTVNLTTPDPAFGLDYIPGRAREASPRVVISNSFAFGGNNTALAFTACDTTRPT